MSYSSTFWKHIPNFGSGLQSMQIFILPTKKLNAKLSISEPLTTLKT